MIGGQEYLIIGPLFLVNVVAGVVIAIAVLVWRHWLPLLAAAGFGAATLVAFLPDRTIGLFGPPSPLVFGAPETIAAGRTTGHCLRGKIAAVAAIEAGP